MGVAERSEYDRGCGNSFAAAFSRALLDPEGETPRLVAGPYGKGTLKRYNVYRNNVTVSLISALASIYPAVLRITGMEFFRAMARFYIRASPPTSPLLFEYGRDFPDFIDRYEYARSMPWLSDAARLERTWLDAYHAADMAPLALQTLAAIPADRLGGKAASLDRLGRTADRSVWYLGDTALDMAAARAAGVSAVLVGDASHDGGIDRARPDLHFPTALDLAARLRALARSGGLD